MHAQCAQKYHWLYHLVGVGAIIANTIAVGLNVLPKKKQKNIRNNSPPD